VEGQERGREALAQRPEAVRGVVERVAALLLEGEVVGLDGFDGRQRV
jgi:hypothetical protein